MAKKKITDETKTITEWCNEFNVTLLDKSYFNDTKLYTKEQYSQIIPKDIEVPLVSDLSTSTAIDNFAKGLIPEDFAKKYKQMKKLQSELEEVENSIKEQLIQMFSTSDGEQKSVSVDGLKFTYVASSQRRTVDSKRLQEEYPEVYKKVIKTSDVKASIRTSIEY